MRLFTPLLALLPLLSALQLPHLPTTAHDALQIADSILHPSYSGSADPATVLGTASDFTLASVPDDEFLHFTSARFTKHKIRIKATKGFCDPSVRSYSGYLDVGDGKDLFFYFFESRSSPKTDPVVMWINGGPGCSSALGLFMELGPCSVKDDPKGANDTVFNPYAWNDKANIFFLDEPIGVGFSYAEHHQSVARAEAAGKDVQAFISIFFETFKEFEGRAFHMAGESYGGRYLPIFASAVVDGNRKLVAQGKTPINLQSVMIGNGVTDTFTTTESYFTYQCTIHGGLNTTVQSIENCVAMAEAVPKCHKFTLKGCIETNDYTTCSMALDYCEEMLGASFLWAGVNPYDVSKPCSGEELSKSLCYSVTDKIRTFLDLPEVRKTLGVDPSVGGFSSCSNKVGRRFHAALDSAGQTWLYVSALLERGVRVLNYVGTYDFICNHIANERWMEALEWTGKAGYNAAEFAEWKVDDKVAGSYKTYGNLSHLKILYAGHMVPYDKPKEALTMLNSWLAAEALGKSETTVIPVTDYEEHIEYSDMTNAALLQDTPPRVGINGFGRIGRAVFRQCLARTDLELVAVNHTALTLEHLMTAIRHDSTHGPCAQAADLSIAPADHPGLLPPTVDNPAPSALVFRGRLIHLLSQRDPARLDWAAAGAEYVMESTGKYTTRAKAALHISHGKAKKVLISAPSKDVPNVVYGVNHTTYTGADDILSNASCTTNCLAPIALVLQRAFGVETGMMTTIHASTSSQKVLDGFSTKDVRSGRSAMGNIIPATTGAAQAVVKVLPELAGKFHGISVRVPVTNVSLVDLTVRFSTPIPSKHHLMAAFREAATTPIQTSAGSSSGAPCLKGVLGVSDEKLVSSDYLSSTESSIIDVDASVMLDEYTGKVVAWYDNEVGFSSRMCDLVVYMAKCEAQGIK